MNRRKERTEFRPSVFGAPLEDRLVLSSTSAAVVPVAPLPAPAPVHSDLVISNAQPWHNVRQLRKVYAREVKVAALELRNVIAREISATYHGRSDPSSQEMTNLTSAINGALDGTALQLSSEASLMPAANNRLVPGLQNSVLGSSSRSLASRVNSILQSAGGSTPEQQLQRAVGQVIAQAPAQLTGQLNNFFNTNNVNQLAVNSSGQQIPLQQFMANQVVSQLGNSLATLAQNFPIVANSTLFPGGVGTALTSTASQSLLNQFDTMASNAISTTAMELGSELSLFAGNSNVASQLDSMLFGTGATTGTTGITTGTGTTGTFGATSLTPTLLNLLNNSAGSLTGSTFNSAFNTAFQGLVSPLDSFLGVSGATNATLPTTGLTNPFSSPFSETFNSGFNNGFSTTVGSTGFAGFGAAPTVFDTNFGTGFNDVVTSITQTVGLSNPSLTNSGNPLGGVIT